MTVTCSCLYPGGGPGCLCQNWSLRCCVLSSFYRVRRTVKKVQSPKVVLGRPHKPCHKLSLKAALGGSCSPTSYGPNRAAPPKISTVDGIYDRPGPWGVDSIEPNSRRARRALKTDLAHCH